jgi:hypothetical protein
VSSPVYELTGNLPSIPCRLIRDNRYEFPSHGDVSLDARELVRQILTPNPQERSLLHDALLPATSLSISARDMPPDF